MAIIYVDSNAGGANDGTSFADAFLSLASVSASIGDTVLVASDHSESLSSFLVMGDGTQSMDWVDIISVNSSTEVYETGASITNSSNISFRNVRIWGLTISMSTLLSGGSGQKIFFIDCEITFALSTLGPDGPFYSHNTDFIHTGTISIFRNPNGHAEIYGGSVVSSGSGTGDALVQLGPNAADWSFFGVDLSGINAESWIESTNNSPQVERVRIVDCETPSGITAFTSGDADGCEVEIINSVNGTITAPAVGSSYHNVRGSCETDTAVSRTGGASDGETGYALKLTALASQTVKGRPEQAVKTFIFGISVWVEPGDTQLRLHLAHDGVGSGTAGALQSDEFWPRVLTPSEAGSATAQHRLVDPGVRYGETPVDLDSDDATWSGTGVGTKQRVDIAITPTEPGYATVWGFFATGSGSEIEIHLCPKITVS